jgi:hypothetical protein
MEPVREREKQKGKTTMKATILFAGLTAALLFGAPASASETSTRDEVIQAYIDWRGGEAYISMENMVRQGAIEVSGLEGSVQLIQTRDGKRRLELDLSVVQYAEGLSQHQGWIQNSSGQIEDMGEINHLIAQRELALIFGKPLIERRSDVVLVGEELHEGQQWNVLQIAFDDGDAFDLFIDPMTGAMEWIRVRRDTDTYWQQWSDWEVIEGVRLPQRQAELHENAAENQVFAWEATGLNIPLPPGTFEQPAAERSTQFADSATTTGWLPFNFFRGQRVFLPLSVNGVETFSVLDSGAEMTVIDTALAETLGLETTGSAAASGTGGTVEVQFATDVTIQFGNITMEGMTIAVLDMSDIGLRLLNGQLPMILGKEIFNETVVDIDYPNSRIAFHHPDYWSYDGDGTTLALPDLEGSRAVVLTVNGEEVLTGFDIGQGSALTLFEAYVEESGLLDGRPSSTRLGGGVGGEVISTLATIEEVEFGGVAMRDIPTSFSLNTPGSFDTTREQGNLGTDIFNRFRMVVNYSVDQLHLEPDTERVVAPFDFDHAGAQLQLDGDRAHVVHLMANSPAAASVLEVGDVVVAINGQAIDGDYWLGDLWRWPYAAPGSEAVLTLEDGREVRLTLARYY